MAVEVSNHGSRLDQASIYPFSIDDRVESGKEFQKAKLQLEAKLKSIRSYFNSPHAPAHTAPPACDRCNSKNHRIAGAYHDFYSSNPPYGVDESRYRDALDRALRDPSGPQLAEMHRVFGAALQQHLKNDLCASQPGDNEDTQAYKDATASMFDSGNHSTQEIVQFYIESQLKASKETKVAEFIKGLQYATTPEQRAQAYINFYCKSDSTDTAQQRNFKTKYTRIFEQLNPHDTVVSAMRSEAEEAQASKVSKLSQSLGEMQMAFSAHQKNKARKAEKDKRMNDREISPRYANCGMEDCPLDINIQTDETIECTICEWLERKGSRRERVYYCSVEHAEEDFENHDRREHQCCMGPRCIYYPDIGPGGESRQDGGELCGICFDCEDHGIISFFCSNDCYQTNMESHRDESHYDRGVANKSQNLDTYTPSPDLEVVESHL
ncbi:hypothetical protein GLAREA_02391 [Glarea lozoyensis ATCC 20868]|uniref:Uncharacterized protein n=1 Tax=Glarea lozoyensis (strain ATCC 20868 / MF5171) TaxID=1116229 RepID=S3DIU8_GLAL2|nr:uncharacterized protein GLAREA_02391 [Glarea lozoyensis ATCC 20868]EPE26478.1 hypothetical protein GLAREA_02391 [Glarea lozoyensis ATCC 20868]